MTSAKFRNVANVLPAGMLAVFAGMALAAGIDPQIVERFEAQSLPVPAMHRVIICHGFACKWRTEIGFDAKDHATLAKLMTPGRAAPQTGARAAARGFESPEAERRAIAAAVAWYGRRIAPESGTTQAKARAGPSSSGDPTQIDCIEAALNTTQLLLMLEGLNLLRFHRVEATVSRMRLLELEWHSTAVLLDLKSNRKWAVDSWVRDSGQEPDILPLEQWYDGN